MVFLQVVDIFNLLDFKEFDMSTQALSAIAREKSSKGAVRALREKGYVPAVIYGGKEEPQMVAVSLRDLKVEMNKGGFFTHNHELDIDGKKIKVLPREISREPVFDKIIHADFMRYDPARKVKVMVRVRAVDEELSPGLKKGGVLSLVRSEIELLCRADSIPSELTISVAGLNVGDSAHFSAISLADGVECTIRDRDFTVASVLSTRTSTMAEIGEEGGDSEEGGAEASAEESAE